MFRTRLSRSRWPLINQGRQRLLVAAVAAVLAGGVAACGGGNGLGDDHPPASLDPASPHVAAVDIAFDTQALTARADQPFVLVFENRDAVQHNVSIYGNGALEGRSFQGALFSGPATRWYPVPALAAGEYVFACDLHSNMRGVLRVR